MGNFSGLPHTNTPPSSGAGERCFLAVSKFRTKLHFEMSNQLLHGFLSNNKSYMRLRIIALLEHHRVLTDEQLPEVLLTFISSSFRTVISIGQLISHTSNFIIWHNQTDQPRKLRLSISASSSIV